MPSCFVDGCRNNTTSGKNNNIRYYSFPKSPVMKSKWLEACGKSPSRNVKYGKLI